jgi:hypothetical protein
MRLIRELSRRKLRTTLTVLGITIGIWSLVVFSSMANRINGFVGRGSDFYAGKIIVTDGKQFGTSPIGLAAKDAIAVLPGVAAVDPQVQVLWNRDGSGANFSIPKTAIGLLGNPRHALPARNHQMWCWAFPGPLPVGDLAGEEGFEPSIS